MKKIIFGILAIAMPAMSAFAACSYNLDASSSQISQTKLYAVNAIKFPTLSGQTFGYQITSNDNDPSNMKGYAAGTSTFIQRIIDKDYTGVSTTIDGDKVLNSSGIYAVELKINNFQVASISGNASLDLGVQLVGISNHDKSAVSMFRLVKSSSGLNLFVVIIDMINQQVTSLNYPASIPSNNDFRVGIYFNQSNKQFGLILNGVNKGYLGSPLSNNLDSLGISTLGVNTNVPSNASYLGGTISGKLITDPTEMTQIFPLGAMDICSNKI